MTLFHARTAFARIPDDVMLRYEIPILMYIYPNPGQYCCNALSAYKLRYRHHAYSNAETCMLILVS